jgi:AcrR family transcriptional regulator
MTRTPWGPTERLRERGRRAGAGAGGSQAESRRELLMAGSVAVIAESGYEAARVSDILAVAGLSRNTFYEHFENKRACFLATAEEVARMASREMIEAFHAREGSGEERLGAAFGRRVVMVSDQPAAARICFCETDAACPEAVELIDRFSDVFEELAIRTLRAPGDDESFRELVRAVVGGLRNVIRNRLRRGAEAELEELAPRLLRWALSYRPPPRPLPRPAQPAPHPAGPGPCGDARERILRAVTDLVSEKSYPAMTISSIATRAGVSLSTFYLHFEGKEEAFIAAMSDGERRLQEATFRAFGAAPDWPHAADAGARAFFEFLAADPPLARLGGVAVYSSSVSALERRDAYELGFQALLEPGYADYPLTDRVTSEAVGSAIAALFYRWLRIDEGRRLYEIAPLATFIALAPFMGNGRACAVARGE